MATNTPAIPAPAKPAITLTRGELHAIDAGLATAKAITQDRATDDAALMRMADKAELGDDVLPIGDLTEDLGTLRTAFSHAHSNWAHAERGRASAQHAKDVAAVWMSRIAYRTATHHDVANKRYPYNITGAAKVLGMPVGTLRPYALAGQALDGAERAGLLSEPDVEDITLLNDSFDNGAREQQRQKRLKEKETKLALEEKARELEALKAAQDAKAPEAPAGDDKAPEAPAAGTSALLPEGAATGTDKAPEAPAKAPEAPAGPSLQEDTVTAAKELVRKIKALRASKDWSAVAKEVGAILAEVYPSLKP